MSQPHFQHAGLPANSRPRAGTPHVVAISLVLCGFEFAESTIARR